MERVKYIEDEFQTRKYVLKEDYKGYGIYKEICSNGLRVHQSWLVVSENETRIVIHPFMELCYEEILDMIDNHIEVGGFGYRAFKKGANIFVLHRNGKEVI